MQYTLIVIQCYLHAERVPTLYLSEDKRKELAELFILDPCLLYTSDAADE